jgi:hypothetical protein
MKFTKEEIEKLNEKNMKESEEEYNNFISSFSKGNCFYCGEKITSFNENKPCAHWLLCPEGIKKEDFGILLKKFGCFRLMAYLRWIANQEAPFININDLKIESKESRVFEVTIKYQNKEWTFCCSKCDLEGHDRFKFPHYHFNMSINGKRFINFHDFHLKLTDEDLFELDSHLGKNENIQFHWGRGAGMQELMNLPKEKLINSLKTSEDTSKETIHLSNWIEAKPGKTIRGDDIQDIIDESRKTGETFTSLARKKLKDTSIMTIISPGEAVVELKKRYSRGDKLKKKV